MTVGSGLLIVSTIVLLNNAAGQGYGRPPSFDINGGAENFGFEDGEHPYSFGRYLPYGHGRYSYAGSYPTGNYEREMYGNSGDTYGLIGSYMNRDYRHDDYPHHYGRYSNGPYGSVDQYGNGGEYNTNPSRYASGGSEYTTPGRYASGNERYVFNGQFRSGIQLSNSMPPISHNSDRPATSFSDDIAPDLAPEQAGPVGSADKNSNPFPTPYEVLAAADDVEKTSVIGGLAPVKDGLDSTATLPGLSDNGAARGVKTLTPVNDDVVRESTPDSTRQPAPL